MRISVNTSNREMINAFFTASGYCLGIFCLQLFLHHIGIVSVLPDDVTLLRYDAGIYEGVSRTGYVYHDAVNNNAGVYILFPWVWRLLHVGITGISFFNLFFFSAGFAIIARLYPVPLKERLLWLSVPSLYFMWVPYTEALFCLITAATFYGIATSNKWVIWLCLFLLSLTRATAIFLIPALLLMELLTNERKHLINTLVTYLWQYALPCIAGLAFFVAIQYYDTGVWFAYYKQQAGALGHVWSWPVLPFSNFFGGMRVSWLSGLSMFICIVALAQLAIMGYKWLVEKAGHSDKVLVLTVCYLPITLAAMVFCNPTWGSGTTNLLGLHRYTLCTPFIFVFLYHYSGSKRNYTTKELLSVFVLCNIVWLMMGSYVHLQMFLFWNVNTLLVLGYMWRNNKEYSWITILLFAFCVLTQLSLHQQYLSNLFTD